MDQAYLDRAATDLSQRVSSLVLNNQTVQIREIERTGSQLVVITKPVSGITKVTSLKLLDEKGALITQRAANVDVPDSQILEFRFEFGVKGGTA